MHKESKARLLSFLYPAAFSGFCCGRSSRSQADRPCSIPIFFPGVCPWPTSSAILYPPLVTRAGGGYWTSRASELAELLHPSTGSCSGFVLLALCFWLCPLWCQKTTKIPFLTRLRLRRTGATSCSGDSEGQSSPLPFLWWQPEPAIPISTNTAPSSVC